MSFLPGTVPHQAGKVVRAEALGSVGHDGCLHAQAVSNEVVMHSAHRQHHWDGRPGDVLEGE
jgi:hypothetical protein